jgi:hypothetical protein
LEVRPVEESRHGCDPGQQHEEGDGAREYARQRSKK